MILGIMTGGETLEIVLVDKNGRVVLWNSSRPKHSLSERILLDLDRVLKRRKISLKDISKIVVYSGPGSFTSLRIGHSVANTLGMALDIPLAGIKESEIKDNFTKSVFNASKKARRNVTLVPFYGRKPNITKPKGR